MTGLKRYINERERRFYEERAAALEQVEAAYLAEAPFLFASRQTVTEALTRYELFRRTLHVGGAIIECGVHRGNNLLLFSHLSSILEPYAINRRIYGFDTFAGFRGVSGHDPSDISERDFADTSSPRIEKAIELYDLNRAAGHMPKTEIVKGDATRTIPEFVTRHPELTVALLYLDFDIYEPTRVALDCLLPLVAKGGIVAFDEFNYDRFPGATQALKGVRSIADLKIERLPFDPFVCFFVVD